MVRTGARYNHPRKETRLKRYLIRRGATSKYTSVEISVEDWAKIGYMQVPHENEINKTLQSSLESINSIKITPEKRYWINIEQNKKIYKTGCIIFAIIGLMFLVFIVAFTGILLLFVKANI